MSLKLQIGKAEQIFKKWGWDVDRRRLKHWLDRGWVSYKSQGAGHGSVRFLTAKSLMDVYLASQLSHDLASSLVESCIRAVRKYYQSMLRDERDAEIRRIDVVFGINHMPAHLTQVRVNAGDAIALINAVRRSGSASSVQRGRPARDWREEFEENLAEIGRALREHGRLTPEAIREDIRTYRARRTASPEEVHVAVPS